MDTNDDLIGVIGSACLQHGNYEPSELDRNKIIPDSIIMEMVE